MTDRPSTITADALKPTDLVAATHAATHAATPSRRKGKTPGATMAERIDYEIEENPLGHQWVAHATISIDRATAKRAAFRGSFRAEAGMRIDALDVICHICRRPHDELVAEHAIVLADWKPATKDEAPPAMRCEGQIDNTHLIGGDPSVRAKRNVPEVQGEVFYQGITRTGMHGFSVHAGK